MANAAANHVKYLLAYNAIDFVNDEFKIILMASGFAFNKDTHHGYADVLASELGTGNGYTQGDKVLTGIAMVEDDTDDRCEITWDNASWTAVGGSIGPARGAIIYDEDVAGDPIIGYIDFGSDYTQAEGGTATITGIEVRLS
jgi:hypothetical protein